MRCPYCSSLRNRVIDSRLSKEGDEIRRRRLCSDCKRRFTTYEKVAQVLPLVVKRDGRREPFNREKIMIGLRKACEKRPVSMDILEKVVERIERWAQEKGGKEMASSEIGEWVMEELQELDEVAYVRFASVYRQFKDINQFMKELKGLLERRERRGVHRDS
ncbi:MAG: transcriptional repressor NrdR [Deltaproteobacteria bacterium]|nr:MAG: transcriptional repressor NrdR [Deltaproteobacteria bacterium]